MKTRDKQIRKGVRAGLNYTLVCILLGLLSDVSLSQAVVDWSLTLGGSSWEQEPVICALPGGGCLVAGNTYSDDGDLEGSLGDCDIVVLKLDVNGTILWQERFGGESTDLVSDMIILPEGGALICGRSRSTTGIMAGMHQGLFDVLAFCISADGMLIWSSAFGGSNSDHANAVCHHPNGGVVLACKSNSFDGDTGGEVPSHDIWLLHLDDNGNLIQQSTLGEEIGIGGYAAYEFANDLVLGDDENIVVVGLSTAMSEDYTEDGPFPDQYIAKLDSDFNVVWETFAGGSDSEEVQVVWPIADGSVMTGGFTWSSDFLDANPNGGEGCLGTLMKINGSGGIEWAQIQGGDDIDRIFEVCPSNQGGWLAVGISESNSGPFMDNAGLADLWLMEFDNEGQLAYQELMGGSQNDTGNSIAMDYQTGRIFLAGTSYSFDGDLSDSQGQSDFWLLGLDSRSHNLSSMDMPAQMHYDLGSESLLWMSESTPSGEVTVFNSFGQVVLRQTAGWSTVSFQDIPSGHYVAVANSTGLSSSLRVFVP